MTMGRDKEILEGFPYPGWTVVGAMNDSCTYHGRKTPTRWWVSFASLWPSVVAKRLQIVFGPYQRLPAKVNSYLDIFRLLTLFSKLQQWFLEDYKSWVYEHVMGPRQYSVKNHSSSLKLPSIRDCQVSLDLKGFRPIDAVFHTILHRHQSDNFVTVIPSRLQPSLQPKRSNP